MFCTHIISCKCIQMCIHVYTHACVHAYWYMYTYLYTRVYTYLHICMCVYKYLYMYIFKYVYMCIYSTYIYAIYTHIYNFPLKLRKTSESFLFFVMYEFWPMKHFSSCYTEAICCSFKKYCYGSKHFLFSPLLSYHY